MQWVSDRKGGFEAIICQGKKNFKKYFKNGRYPTGAHASAYFGCDKINYVSFFQVFGRVCDACLMTNRKRDKKPKDGGKDSGSYLLRENINQSNKDTCDMRNIFYLPVDENLRVIYRNPRKGHI